MAEVHRTRRGALMELIRKTVANPPKECVIWPYGHSMGYGKVQFERRVQQAHRVSLILYSGKNPPHLHACHGPCHNRLCINPLHLAWQTQLENNADKHRDGTHKTGKDAGANRKLTECNIRAIRNDPRRHKIIAKEYGVTPNYICTIKAGNAWSWVPMDPPPDQGLFS